MFNKRKNALPETNISTENCDGWFTWLVHMKFLLKMFFLGANWLLVSGRVFPRILLGPDSTSKLGLPPT